MPECWQHKGRKVLMQSFSSFICVCAFSRECFCCQCYLEKGWSGHYDYNGTMIRGEKGILNDKSN